MERKIIKRFWYQRANIVGVVEVIGLYFLFSLIQYSIGSNNIYSLLLIAGILSLLNEVTIDCVSTFIWSFEIIVVIA